MGLDPAGVPQINYISPTGTFDIVDRKFSAVFRSHCIEHQPDFVRHLRNVSWVLETEGRYYIICPDKRFCFDNFRATTSIADVVAAYLLEDEHHQRRSFPNQILRTTQNDPQRHWLGDHGLPTFKTSNDLRVDTTRSHIEATEYLDCHAWQFRPQVFFETVSTLARLELTDLHPEHVYQTPANLFEFVVVLSKTQVPIEMRQAFISGDDDESRSAPKESEVREPRTAVAQLQQQVALDDGKVGHLTTQVARLREQLRQVYASRTWPVTAPLRRVASRLKSQ